MPLPRGGTPLGRASGNLLTVTKHDDELRARVARGWTESGLPQEDYAQAHGISARTLRSWVSRYASSDPPAKRARAAIANAIQALRSVLAALEADLGAEPREDSVQHLPGDRAPSAAPAESSMDRNSNAASKRSFFSDL